MIAAQNLSSWETEGEPLVDKGRHLISYIFSQLSTDCKTVDDKEFMCHLCGAKRQVTVLRVQHQGVFQSLQQCSDGMF